MRFSLTESGRRRTCPFLVVFLGVACRCTGSRGPSSQAPQRQVGNAKNRSELRRQAVLIDLQVGWTLDDPIWVQAAPISNFLQREPYEGQTPT